MEEGEESADMMGDGVMKPGAIIASSGPRHMPSRCTAGHSPGLA